ncbi:HEAT repeat domain-containing protein [Halococcus dombrowskii]|uniref:HEAT repeat domain-containing protein n=1 Tax=Halococcus dombrowskii TaxID=179637 RepID=A0AAV3SDI3_HALDO|nr:HEAT repeat domain-containing protein [Halococcus dombrowskii]UOO94135.1 HEAT repeat domain-containing protein [Halococcus dombrowskii]
MSDGDEPADDGEQPADEDGGELEARTPEALDERLDEIEAELDEAETEADLDSVESDLDEVEAELDEAETEADLDSVESDLDEVEAEIEAADLPEPDEDEEDADDPREELESRVTELRDALDDQRGPYAEDAVEEIEGAKSTLTETRWTEQGEDEIADTVHSFLDSVGETLDEEFTAANDESEGLAAALDDVIAVIEERALDPDDDAETVAELIEAADELTTGLDDAEEWDDLSVREKLTVEGFYDVLTPETRKDFPPEWNAIKIYEEQGDPDPILRGLDMFGSEFMEEHCIESLKRMGAPEAYDVMEERAQKRNKPPIEVLGKIGDDRALDTLHEYIEGESDPALQKVTIKAIGEIGSTESTQAVADRLVADNETVRSNAARALGLIGDTRAIAPLADVLSDDDSNAVRASAAWALNQIGTENALDAAREHADDRSFLVQSEAEKADHALADENGDAAETTA